MNTPPTLQTLNDAAKEHGMTVRIVENVGSKYYEVRNKRKTVYRSSMADQICAYLEKLKGSQ